MKAIFFTVAFFAISISTAQNSFNKEFWQQDKVFHTITTASISATTYALLEMNSNFSDMSEIEKRLISFTASMLVGFVKEGSDLLSSKSHASWGDVEANLIGALSFQAAITIPLELSKSKNTRRFRFANGFASR